MYKFWYDYVKLNYGEKPKFCYMDTDSFIVCIKTDDIQKDIEEDVKTRFDTQNSIPLIDHYQKEKIKE